MGGIKKEEKVVSTSSTASVAKKTAAVKKGPAKKPVAGIDEEGTFRAWDNAKTVAKSKKPAAPANSVEERALDKKATAEAAARAA